MDVRRGSDQRCAETGLDYVEVAFDIGLRHFQFLAEPLACGLEVAMKAEVLHVELLSASVQMENCGITATGNPWASHIVDLKMLIQHRLFEPFDAVILRGLPYVGIELVREGVAVGIERRLGGGKIQEHGSLIFLDMQIAHNDVLDSRFAFQPDPQHGHGGHDGLTDFEYGYCVCLKFHERIED